MSTTASDRSVGIRTRKRLAALKPPPKDYDSLRERIATDYGTLSRRLQQVADYALNNPNDMALETIATLSTQIAVAPSVLIRFAKALGFGGFSDLQSVFRLRLTELAPSYNERIRHLLTQSAGANDPSELLNRFVEGGIHALNHLRAETSGAMITAAVDILAAARNIHIVGFRRSYPVASYLFYTLNNLSCRAHLLDNTGGMLKRQMNLMNADDALIAISFSSYSSETLGVLEHARSVGVPIVSITDTMGGPLKAATPVCFEIDEASDTQFRSLNACITLALTLTVALGQRLEKRQS